MLEHNDEWKKLGGRLLVPVHDEILAEVPIENWKRGGELLSELMCKAAEFLPFPSKCDVETSLRWYGLSYPCPYKRPEFLENMTEDEIKWIQYTLFECEYLLPIFNDENGDKPKGDAAKGVNGVMTDEVMNYIADYKAKFKLNSDKEFLDHIERRVFTGVV